MSRWRCIEASLLDNLKRQIELKRRRLELKEAFNQVLWFTGRTSPVSSFSTGGRPVRGPAIYNEKVQTSDSPGYQLASWKFADGFDMTWEHRRFSANNHMEGENVGVLFYGEKGILHLGWREGWTFYPQKPNVQAIPRPTSFSGAIIAVSGSIQSSRASPLNVQHPSSPAELARRPKATLHRTSRTSNF